MSSRRDAGGSAQDTHSESPETSTTYPVLGQMLWWTWRWPSGRGVPEKAAEPLRADWPNLRGSTKCPDRQLPHPTHRSRAATRGIPVLWSLPRI